MTRRAPAYTQKRRTQDAQRATLVQILTYAPDLSRKTPGELARATGLSEPECAAALERERMFREARRG